MKSDGSASKIAAMITSRINATNNPTGFVDQYYFVMVNVHAHVSLIVFPRSWSLWSIQIDVCKVNKNVQQFWKGSACCHCIINAFSDDIENSCLTNNKPRVRRKNDH